MWIFSDLRRNFEIKIKENLIFKMWNGCGTKIPFREAFPKLFWGFQLFVFSLVMVSEVHKLKRHTIAFLSHSQIYLRRINPRTIMKEVAEMMIMKLCKIFKSQGKIESLKVKMIFAP